MSNARNLARLLPNASGQLPSDNIQNNAVSREKLSNTATLQQQVFVSNGTFVVPQGVTKLFVSLCGGGGGGGSTSKIKN